MFTKRIDFESVILIGSGDLAELEAPQVQLGSVMLRLNSWRFREGFYTGQEDAQAGKDERSSQQALTAHELLGSIAHRDSETGRYFFTEEEINAIEDTLGQFTGYLCTLLFPRKDVATTPVQQPMTVFHQA